MVKFNQRFDYYDLLGIEPEDLETLDAEEAERYVEKAYKETARRVHPDKVKVVGLTEDEATTKKEEATAMFQELQKAYEVIKDPMQREDYNLYRKKNATPDSFKPDIVPTGGLRFSGYTDEPRGFFKVYGEVFDKIYANEVAFQELKKLPPDSVVSPPQIGDENRPYPAVVQFYNYWLNFTTIMDFTWDEPHDEYDLAAAPTKKGVAVMKRKNMKARKKGRNEYNNKVRRFVQYVRRRDIRVLEMTAKRGEEMKKEIEEEKKRKRKLKKEKMEKAAVEYEEAEWTKPVERKRKYGVEEKEDSEEEREECWECVVCRKEFKSEKQWLNHEMSKKHKDMMALLMGLKDRNLVEDVLELMEEEKEDEEELDELDDHVDEERESDSEDGVSECVDEYPKEEVVNEEVVVDGDEEEEEEDENEMEVLEAMVARRKTNVKVVSDEPMVTIIVKEEDEVAMEHEEIQNVDKNGVEKKPRRRRAKSTRINEGDDKKESKSSDSGEESCVDNGSEEDERKRKKGGKKENRSKRNTKSSVENEDSDVKNSKFGSRTKYAGKKSRRDIHKN